MPASRCAAISSARMRTACPTGSSSICRPILDADGNVQKFIGVARDVTVVRSRTQLLEEAQRAAERAEQRLTTAIDAMSEGFLIYDEHDRLVVANNAFKKLGYIDADIIVVGRTFQDMLREAVERGHYDLSGEDPETWMAKHFRNRREMKSTESVYRFSDGRWILRRERRTPLGEMVGVRVDVTAFKQQEEALHKARADAEAANRAKSDFVANVSHELRTPINSIIGFNHLMLAGELSPKQRESAEIIQASSEHLLQLVNDVLDLSKIASDCIELEAAPFDLAGLVQETVLSLMPLAEAKGIELLSQIGLARSTVVAGDAGRIRQILINLIGNAIKFTSEGSVKVFAAAKGGGFLFKVIDTGDGIPRDKIHVIFDRFSQVKENIKHIQGADLGLAITKSLIDLMKGSIEVDSDLGAGATFSVWLPLAKVDAAQTVERPANSRHPEPAGPAPTAPTGYDVLVAEDNVFSQMLIKEILDGMGCQVNLTTDGQQLLDQLESGDFDLVILDNQMPVMTGIEAAQKIRSRDDWKVRIPIIALTADAMKEAERAYREIGVNAFVTKPLNVRQIMDVVQKLALEGRQLREGRGAAAAAI